MALPWNGCQSRQAYFLSPQGLAWEPILHHWTPCELILTLCGVNGSCTYLTPMAMLNGGRSEQGQLEFDWKGSLGSQLQSGKSSGSFHWTASGVKYKSYRHIDYEATPVYVWPPFMWIVSNNSAIGNELYCGSGGCYYTVCWDAQEFPLAVVTRMPRFVPVPVEAPNNMTLFQEKRDFEISAIIVGIVAATAVAASVTASALALSNSVQTTQAINGLSASVSMALSKLPQILKYKGDLCWSISVLTLCKNSWIYYGKWHN